MITRSENREAYHDLINRQKLKGLLVEHDIKRYDLAKELHLTLARLSLKLNSKVDFSEHECYLLMKKFGAIIFLE